MSRDRRMSHDYVASNCVLSDRAKFRRPFIGPVPQRRKALDDISAGTLPTALALVVGAIIRHIPAVSEYFRPKGAAFAMTTRWRSLVGGIDNTHLPARLIRIYLLRPLGMRYL